MTVSNAIKLDDAVAQKWVNSLLNGKGVSDAGIPKEVSDVYKELISKGLSPDEQALYKSMCSSSGRSKGAGGSGMLTSRSASDYLGMQNAVRNKAIGFMLAAIFNRDPNTAANVLLAVFNPVFENEGRG